MGCKWVVVVTDPHEGVLAADGFNEEAGALAYLGSEVLRLIDDFDSDQITIKSKSDGYGERYFEVEYDYIHKLEYKIVRNEVEPK